MGNGGRAKGGNKEKVKGRKKGDGVRGGEMEEGWVGIKSKG